MIKNGGFISKRLRHISSTRHTDGHTDGQADDSYRQHCNASHFTEKLEVDQTENF